MAVFRRGKKLEYVRPGSTFQKIHAYKMIETARVLSVGTDAYGILHVRFQVSFSRPNRNQFDGGAHAGAEVLCRPVPRAGSRPRNPRFLTGRFPKSITIRPGATAAGRFRISRG